MTGHGRDVSARPSQDVAAPAPLTVDAVSVRLGGRLAVSEAGLVVREGELVGLLGPNGAGKTTLLRAVLGLLPLASGTVTARARIGYVPQRHEFAWDFPVDVAGAVLSGRTRQIGWLRRAGASDRAAADEALERTGLTALRRRPVGELSGGQRQRVLVARALATEPDVLLLDEPFTGVDVPTQDVLGALFAGLAQEGRALLMTTHDLAAAARSCTRVVLLNRSVVAEGGPELLSDPEQMLRAFGLDRAIGATARGSGSGAGTGSGTGSGTASSPSKAVTV
ncbi:MULTISPECIES: anchored repeat-type ABC transporter ATP-binding subunit [unclassified Streptomyces]|uniref:anchored repeat-type ABC transporter ATP-binding subunit n=1 Tax=unclassified Streptomyces TaxID=2593676 RepID=UPI00081F460F|nr:MULTISPECIES: anchored repeat-type ABC transporter ATP-binding subunit [unclassified Streptomyces]MYZ36576.1 anchored repeat-type ABC transporter ATP-binding subunit [Streptomyces sp. SID4917]SCF84603.1 manganese/iron transport system ATP-binding protein [Streptomyces sp. MnatMP-M17]